MVSEKRIGVIGIIVEDRQQVPQVNSLLSSFNEVIIGRMGLPTMKGHCQSSPSLLMEALMKLVL